MTKKVDVCVEIRQSLDAIRAEKSGRSVGEIRDLLALCGFELSRSGDAALDVWRGYGKTITVPRLEPKRLMPPFVVQVLRLCEQAYFLRCDNKIYEVK